MEDKSGNKDQAGGQVLDCETRYRLLFEANPQPMWVYEIATLQFLTVNDVAIRQYGYSREEFLGMTIMDIRPVDQREKLAQCLERHGGEFRKQGIWKHLRKDGSTIDADIATHDLEFDGRRARLVIALDVTEQIRHEEALQRQARVLESMAEGVVVTDANGTILLTNPAFDSMFGYDKGELFGKHAQILNNKTPDSGRFFEDMVGKLISEGSWCGELENRKKDGTVFYTSARMSTLEVAGNRSWVSVQEDITERKEIERLKDEMISAVSHEMRTPLTALLGYLQFLHENDVDEAQRKEFVGIMQKETERLSDLMDNFLELRRLKAKKIAYSLKPVSICEIVRETAALFLNASPRHGITVDVPAGLPPVLGDEASLHQVFNNLISNAIKYSPEGGKIVVSVKYENDNVILRVKDEGIGIAPESIDKVFTRFYRINDKALHTVNGTGLGLAVVKQIILAHYGKVWVESTVGEGSAFYVSLPVPSPALTDSAP